MSRSKHVACVPLCSTFTSNSPGYMDLKNIYELSSSIVFIRSYWFFANSDFEYALIKKKNRQTDLLEKKKKKNNRETDMLRKDHVQYP